MSSLSRSLTARTTKRFDAELCFLRHISAMVSHGSSRIGFHRCVIFVLVLQATLLYSKAIEMFPESSHLYLGRAKAQLYEGNLHGARGDLQLSVAKDPNNLEAAERLRQLTASKVMVPTSNNSGRPRSSSRSTGRHQRPAIVFPRLPHSSSMELKILPGYGRKGEGVPPSFGSGFQVMPKADLARAKIRNKLRSTRPVP